VLPAPRASAASTAGNDQDFEQDAGGQPHPRQLHAAHPSDDYHVRDAHGDLGEIGGGEGPADARDRDQLVERLLISATFHTRLFQTTRPDSTRCRASIAREGAAQATPRMIVVTVEIGNEQIHDRAVHHSDAGDTYADGG
jgi:hypothetical protein